VLDDLMKSIYSASCSTSPMAPDFGDRELRWRRRGCFSGWSCFLARVAPASIIAASRALEREVGVPWATETIGTLNVAAWTEATHARQLSKMASFILKMWLEFLPWHRLKLDQIFNTLPIFSLSILSFQTSSRKKLINPTSHNSKKKRNMLSILPAQCRGICT
jgi:hypothetical protein